MAGDCLMLGFGVPLEQPDSAQRAVQRGARDARRASAHLAQSWKERYQIEAGLGIGINEGDVVAGNIGSSSYMNYTIIGDTVNIAARLCQRARAGEMLFSSSAQAVPRCARHGRRRHRRCRRCSCAAARTRSTSTACRCEPRAGERGARRRLSATARAWRISPVVNSSRALGSLLFEQCPHRRSMSPLLNPRSRPSHSAPALAPAVRQRARRWRWPRRRARDQRLYVRHRRRRARARAAVGGAALLRRRRAAAAAPAGLGGAALRPVLAAPGHHLRAPADAVRAAARDARLPDRRRRHPDAAPAAAQLRAGPRLRARRRDRRSRSSRSASGSPKPATRASARWSSPGEFAVRGSLLDVFPMGTHGAAAHRPVRR